MHELSIAESIVEITKKNLPANGGGNVINVKVRIGELVGVVPEALDFCYSAITAGTSLDGSKLRIEKTSIVAHCDDCGADSKVEGFLFKCPVCDGINLKVISGNELQVVEIEVDDRILQG